MIQLANCSKCNGFLGLSLSACPHCDAPVGRVRRAMIGVAAVAGGGAISMTLMACYGGPCVSSTAYTCPGDDAGVDSLDAATDVDAAPTDVDGG